jgi:hypothetical protein
MDGRPGGGDGRGQRVDDTPALSKVSIGDLVIEVVEDDGSLPYGCDSEEQGRASNPPAANSAGSSSPSSVEISPTDSPQEPFTLLSSV